MKPLKNFFTNRSNTVIFPFLVAGILLLLQLLFNIYNPLLFFIHKFFYFKLQPYSVTIVIVATAVFFFLYGRCRFINRERTNITQALQESEVRNKALLSSFSNMVFRVRNDGTFLEFKAENEAKLFIEPSKIVGSKISDVMPPSFAEQAMNTINDALLTNRIQSFEYELFIKGKIEKYVARIVVCGKNEVFVIVHNANDSQIISEALQKSEMRFQAVVENLSEGIIITDLLDRIVYMNKRMTELCGWSLDEVRNKPAYSVLYPKHLWKENIEKIIHRTQGISDHIEMEIVKKDGTLIWVETFSAPYKDEHGKIIGTIETNIDITRRRWNNRLQAALFRITEITQSAQDLKEFFSQLHEIIRGLMYANNFYIALYDRTNQIISFPYFVDEIDPPPQPRKFSRGSTERVLESGEIFHSPRHEFSEMAHRGEVEIIGAEAVDWLGVPLKSGDTTFGALVVQSYNEDIRFGEKEKEILVFVSQHISRAVQQKFEEERFRNVWEYSSDGMRVTDKAGTIIMVNEAYCKLVEKKKEEVLDKNFTEVYNQERMREQHALELYHKRFTTETFLPHIETELELWNNKIIPVEITTSLISFGINERMLLSIFRDISERKKLEEQLLHAQKMDSIGVLAGGIAHDFNNVLTMIMGSADLIKNRSTDQPDIYKFAQMISSAAERGSGIAKQLLMFARTEKNILRPLSLVSMVTDVCKLLEHSMPKSISIVTSFETQNDVIMGDGDQIHQVLINLAVNARDALEFEKRAGVISFTVSEMNGDELRKQFAKAAEEHYVALRVSDNGCGMEEETVQRIFEPFFTTKERGKGTGLGLSIVHGIIKSHNAFIDVESTVNIGTTFTMYFPAALVFEPSISVQPIQKETIRLQKQVQTTKKILVVDDEAPIAETIREELESEGYSILIANNGTSAIKIIEENKDEIFLIISDLGMPEMDGRELIKHLRSNEIDIDFIFMTGYLDQTSKSELYRLGAREVLMKPFSLEDITATVQKIAMKQ